MNKLQPHPIIAVQIMLHRKHVTHYFSLFHGVCMVIICTLTDVPNSTIKSGLKCDPCFHVFLILLCKFSTEK